MGIQSKKVVIVLPAYNAAKTLERTLTEIPAEFREHIILVDDASKDNTVELAKKAGLDVYQHAQTVAMAATKKRATSMPLKQVQIMWSCCILITNTTQK